MDQWLIVYRGYSALELEEELTFLRKQIRNPFSAMSEGNRSHQRSTAEFRDRMAAATQVKAENAGADRGARHLTADFSQVQP